MTKKALTLALEMVQNKMYAHAEMYLKEALAQPEQEPVANVVLREGLPTLLSNSQIKPTDKRLYTTPPQRTLVGLTDKERNSLYAAHHNKYDLPNQGSPDGMDYERAIEAKLMEKNSA